MNEYTTESLENMDLLNEKVIKEMDFYDLCFSLEFLNKLEKSLNDDDNQQKGDNKDE